MCMWEGRRFHIFQFVSVLILRKHYFGHWANLRSCLLRTARQFSHACAEKADEELPRSYHLLLVCPRDTPNMRCKFSHTCPDLLIRSGQVKKIFLVRRASERAPEECSKFCLLERAPGHLLFFDFKLRKLFEGCALWIKCNRIVLLERVPLACLEGAGK